jgi:3-oxoadipate enol-lactonase
MPLYNVNDGSGFQLNYEVHENLVPTTTLFIHGNIASNRWWYPAEEFWKFKAKGKNFSGSLIYAEFRGAGKSSPPRNENDVNMHTFANDFISLVRSLNLGKINLVGHSTGGLIVAMMLAKAPELFNQAILLDPVGAGGVKFDPSMDVAFEAMKNDKNLTATVIGSTIYNNNPEADFFKQVVVEDAFHGVKTVGAWVLKALDGLNVKSDIAKVDHRVLVLHGEHDQLLPVADSKEFATLMRNATFETVPGQGHCTNMENPEKFVGIVNKFFFS